MHKHTNTPGQRVDRYFKEQKEQQQGSSAKMLIYGNVFRTNQCFSLDSCINYYIN